MNLLCVSIQWCEKLVLLDGEFHHISHPQITISLAFCIQQICGDGTAAKSSRRLADDSSAANLNIQEADQKQIDKVMIDDTPDEFIITKPTKTDKTYDDFLSFLYRHDTAKSVGTGRVKRAIDSSAIDSVNGDYTRGKRMLVFR